MGFIVLKVVHVLLAIVAVGYNATYGLILQRAEKAPRDTQKYMLETVRALDRVANWAYTGLLLTGGAMVTMAGYSWAALWTAGSAGLLVVALGVAHGLYTPTLRKQIAALDAGGRDSEEYRRYAKRGTAVGIALFLTAVLIVVLMVTKPVGLG